MSAVALPFEQVFEDASSGNLKVQKGDYGAIGRHPIIDQGQEFVGGYTDDSAYLVKGVGPWIIFGDHTRALKFVDFPFCMGADGVKVLKPRPKIEADPRFLYHFLSANEIPSAGYSRHYKFLKRLEIPLPPLPEQRRIAAILDKADALRRKRKRAIELLDSLTQSIFLEMFGDPVSNTRGWSSVTLGDLDVQMAYGPRFYNESYSEDGIRIVRITDLADNGALDFDAMPRLAISPADIATHQSKAGEILFARTGATVGKMALVTVDDPPTIPGAYFIRMRFPDSIVPLFAWFSLRSQSIQKIIYEGSRQSAQQNFSGPGLRRLPMIVPPVSEQHKFCDRVERIHTLRSANSDASRDLNSLFSSLQSRAFSGQL